MKEPILTREESQDIVWQKIKTHIEREIERLRDRLEKDFTPEDTAKTRGELRQLRNLLALGVKD